jgi:group I intron endonuclease
MISGIYCIENRINNKKYIGCSKDIERRWYHHKRDLESNNHSNRYLQSSYNKYGENNFKFSIIQELPYSKKQLQLMETYWIIYFSSFRDFGMGYNLTLGGEGNWGLTLSEETKKRLSEVNKGKILSKEVREKISYGVLKSNTEEVRKRKSESHKGMKRSLDSVKKSSDGIRGEKNYGYGKKRPTEVVERMRQKQIGKKKSEESKLKCARSNAMDVDIVKQIKNMLLEGISAPCVMKILNVSSRVVYRVKNGGYKEIYGIGGLNESTI